MLNHLFKAGNIKEEYQLAIKEQQKKQLESPTTKRAEECDCSKFTEEELKGKKKKD